MDGATAGWLPLNNAYFKTEPFQVPGLARLEIQDEPAKKTWAHSGVSLFSQYKMTVYKSVE